MLQGFKKEEVRIRADNYGHMIVRGERQADDTRILHFEQSYVVPEGCKIEDTSATFEDETYYVVIPKKTNLKENSIPASVQRDDQVQDSMSDGLDNANNNLKRDNDEEEEEEEEEEDESLLVKLSKRLKKKRCLVFAAFLAIALGVVVSHQKGLISYQKGAKKRADDDA